jgi:hypothetical protein
VEKRLTFESKICAEQSDKEINEAVWKSRISMHDDNESKKDTILILRSFVETLGKKFYESFHTMVATVEKVLEVQGASFS